MKDKVKENKRLLSLDALRGFDMFFLMGGGALLYPISQRGVSEGVMPLFAEFLLF